MPWRWCWWRRRRCWKSEPRGLWDRNRRRHDFFRVAGLAKGLAEPFLVLTLARTLPEVSYAGLSLPSRLMIMSNR